MTAGRAGIVKGSRVLICIGNNIHEGVVVDSCRNYIKVRHRCGLFGLLWYTKWWSLNDSTYTVELSCATK